MLGPLCRSLGQAGIAQREVGAPSGGWAARTFLCSPVTPGRCKVQGSAGGLWGGGCRCGSSAPFQDEMSQSAPLLHDMHCWQGQRWVQRARAGCWHRVRWSPWVCDGGSEHSSVACPGVSSSAHTQCPAGRSGTGLARAVATSPGSALCSGGHRGTTRRAKGWLWRCSVSLATESSPAASTHPCCSASPIAW